MKILVTGSAGMLGTSIVPTLVAAGHEVVATDIDLTNPRPWGADGPDRRLARRPGPVRGASRVRHGRARLRAAPRGRDVARGQRRRPRPRLPDQHHRHEVRRARVPRPRRADDLHQHRRRVRRHQGGRALHRVRRARTRSTPTARPSSRARSSWPASSRSTTSSGPGGWSVAAPPRTTSSWPGSCRRCARAARRSTRWATSSARRPTPTTSPTACWASSHSEVYGLYHMACGGEGSRYDVAARILEVLGPRRHRAGRGRLGVLRRGVPVGPAPLGDHAEHGPRPAGHEHHAAVARRPGRVPPDRVRRPADRGPHERLTRPPNRRPTHAPPDRKRSHHARGPEPGQPAPRRRPADTRSVAVVIPIPDDPAVGAVRRHPDEHPDHRERRQRREALAAAPRQRLLLRLRRPARVLRRALRGHAPQERGEPQRRATTSRTRRASTSSSPSTTTAAPGRAGSRPTSRRSTRSVEAPALQPVVDNGWVNSIDAPGVYARGYPYELRTPELSGVEATTATGEVKLNMGVWDGILDLNGIDKLQAGEPGDPALAADVNRIALGQHPGVRHEHRVRGRAHPGLLLPARPLGRTAGSSAATTTSGAATSSRS